MRKRKVEPSLKHPQDKEREKLGKEKKRRRSVGFTVSGPEYDPEKETEIPRISGAKLLDRHKVNRAALEAGAPFRGRLVLLEAKRGNTLLEARTENGFTHLEARTTEAESDPADAGKPVVLEAHYVNVYTARQFLKLVESEAWKTSKLLENYQADAFELGVDSGTNGVGNEYIQIMGGPFSKQLYLYDYLEMHAKAFWLRHHHPLAAAACRILRAFTIGKGLKIMAQNYEVQQELDAFEKRTKFLGDQLRGDVDTLVYAGEVFTQKNHDFAGLPQPLQVDPSTVWEVVTDPANIKNVLYYHQQYPSQWQLTYKPGDIGSEYIINDITAADMIHVKVNCVPGEKRGRSLLFPAMAWLKRYRDYLNAKVIKAQNEESVVLDIKVNGNEQDVQHWARMPENTRAPRPGQVRVHNEEVEYKFLQPTASSTQGRDTVADQLKSDVAVAIGLAPEWLGESQTGGNRATALVKENPASRTIEELQTITEQYVRSVIDWVIDEAKAAGRIPQTQTRKASLGKLKSAVTRMDWQSVLSEAAALITNKAIVEPINLDYEVIFPEAQTEDRAAKLLAIQNAQGCGYISMERASNMTAKELGITSFDWNDEKEQIQSEQAEGVNRAEWGPAAAAQPKLDPQQPGSAASDGAYKNSADNQLPGD